MAKLISKTYGDALLELAVEEDKLDTIASQIGTIKDILDANPEFGVLMNNPRIDLDEKLKVVKEVFEGRAEEEIVGFFNMIVAKGRYSQIDEILCYFLNEVKALKGVGVAYVTTPVSLSDVQKKEVEAKLLKTTKFRSMEMNYIIDESLIGGMQIRIGDRVVDSSVRTKINKMQQQLMGIRL
ncbi:MAG: ATP synthase F1 subunit delta [Lachnospiraceae bacterium]|nr:ATP synthase F1 subunit delta [Lachnospiraceae bacterium]